jgi:hypothetical protein
MMQNQMGLKLSGSHDLSYAVPTKNTKHIQKYFFVWGLGCPIFFEAEVFCGRDLMRVG